MVFKKHYETGSSFAYHHPNEMIEHWTFKKGRTLQSEEVTELKRRIVIEDGHLWIHVLVEQERAPYELKPRKSREC
jgi:ribosomal silencing factor RsfS